MLAALSVTTARTEDFVTPTWLWWVMIVIIVIALAIDLLAHRKDHVIGFKEAAWWSVGWITLAVSFSGLIFYAVGDATPVAGGGEAFNTAAAGDATMKYFTAWLLEKSLSVDNLFVFALIFSYFAVPKAYQHRVLFLGVMGALIFRAIFLAAGVALVSRFVFIFFLFGAILLWSAWKLAKDDEEEDYDPSTNFAVKALKKVMPVSDKYHGTHFFVRENGVRMATPLLAVVVAIEAADLMFAVDSVPAVLAVSPDLFIVYASNAFAILGLRALYFMLSGLLDKFHYLSKGLAIILAFIGIKLIMLASHELFSPAIPLIPTWISLSVIVVVLAGSIILSLMNPQDEDAHDNDESMGDDAARAVQSTPEEPTEGQDAGRFAEQNDDPSDPDDSYTADDRLRKD